MKTRKSAVAVKESAVMTVEPVRAGSFSKVAPEWGRFADVRKTFGIARSTTYNLLNRGLIKSCVLRVTGNKSGLRLIHMASVAALLEREMHAQQHNNGHQN